MIGFSHLPRKMGKRRKKTTKCLGSLQHRGQWEASRRSLFLLSFFLFSGEKKKKMVKRVGCRFPSSFAGVDIQKRQKRRKERYETSL